MCYQNKVSQECTCDQRRYSGYDLCYHVNYPNDGFDDDLLLKKKSEDNNFLYVGNLQKENDVALSVVLLPDPNDPDEDRKNTIVSSVLISTPYGI